MRFPCAPSTVPLPGLSWLRVWFVTDVAWQSPYEARVLQSKDHVFFIPASLVTCLEPVLTGALDTF